MSIPVITPPVVRDDTYDPGRYFPDVVNMTFRDGVTREELVEVIRYWITERLVPFLNTQVELIDAGRQESIDDLTGEVNSALSSQATAINTALAQQRDTVNGQLGSAIDQVIHAAVPISDPVVTGLLNSTSTTTRQKLDSLYSRSNGAGRNAITGWFHVTDYGAVGDGVTDDRAAIQAAIDAANAAYSGNIQERVFLPAKHYLVGVRDMKQSNNSVDGICSLELKSGVELYGPSAVLRAKDNAYGSGAFYAMIRSKYEGLVDAGIDGLTLDGRRGSQVSSTNAGNILLECLTSVHVRNVLSVQSNGNAIMLRGNAYGSVMTNCSVKNCRAYGVNGIGIQCSQFDGIEVTGNVVGDTTDNGIDLYGEHGDHSTTSAGIHFLLNDNRIKNAGNVGLFCETVAYGTVEGNQVANSGTGIRVNRINGLPKAIVIRNNSLVGCTLGMAFSGVLDSVSVIGNEVNDAGNACIQFDGANTAGVLGTNNMLNCSDDTKPLVLVTSAVSVLSQCIIVNSLTKKASNPSYVSYAGSVVSCTFGPGIGPGFYN